MTLIPRWRKATWALAIFNLLMLLWVIAGFSSATQHANDCGSLDQASCDAAHNIGAGIGVTILFFIWFLGFVILSLIWLMSRPRRRSCPRCGNDVRKGLTSCRNCGFDFAVVGAPSVVNARPSAAGSGPVPPTLSPDGNFWWDGRQWQSMAPRGGSS